MADVVVVDLGVPVVAVVDKSEMIRSMMFGVVVVAVVVG
jgi:hypothetical protein